MPHPCPTPLRYYMAQGEYTCPCHERHDYAHPYPILTIFFLSFFTYDALIPCHMVQASTRARAIIAMSTLTQVLHHNPIAMAGRCIPVIECHIYHPSCILCLLSHAHHLTRLYVHLCTAPLIAQLGRDGRVSSRRRIHPTYR